MTSKPDGGPAFPRPGFTERETESQEGMSLRDWLAGQALTGIIRWEGSIIRAPGETYEAAASRVAYQYADAMLARRIQ